MSTALLLEGIRKRFGTTVALDGVDLSVAAGSVHALLGENGAGKSTLMQVAAGLMRPDAGKVVPAGRLGMVHQHFTSIAALTVWENIALPTDWPMGEARARAAATLARHGVAFDLDAPAGGLSVGLRQQLEIQKALASGPRVLILDEPTGVLTPPEVADLFRVVKEFTALGGAVVLITHKLDEALEHADAITVLRHGRVTAEWGTATSAGRPDRSDLIRAMLGTADLKGGTPPSGAVRGEPVTTIRGVTFHRGETIGIAGVEGNGQREFLRSIPTDAFIPEDRTTEGLILEFDLSENLALIPSDRPAILIDPGAFRRRAQAAIETFGIKAPGPGALAGTLSGGNQQKVVVARALQGAPAIVVAENPARGLDVAAAEEIYARLRRAAAEGAAVVFHSPDLDEVLTWADRVLVLRNGEVIQPPAGADRATIGALMVSGSAP
ncbi:MAG TPA: ATP-binding cassette domain-containing protein [Gemmatimonadales bacterium]|nr:ATP-binding cassette domain-containing protein [Gemmatimonadales bacterium]